MVSPSSGLHNGLTFKWTTYWSQLQVDYIMASPSSGLHNGLTFNLTT